jgi:hypothetical protein
MTLQTQLGKATGLFHNAAQRRYYPQDGGNTFLGKLGKLKQFTRLHIPKDSAIPRFHCLCQRRKLLVVYSMVREERPAFHKNMNLTNQFFPVGQDQITTHGSAMTGQER